MIEIATCVRCGQWVHDPENGRVCAQCKAKDLEDENREEIEFALAHLDARQDPLELIRAHNVCRPHKGKVNNRDRTWGASE